jgi:glycosyltransferase involved in cell wall biosynthesis
MHTSSSCTDAKKLLVVIPDLVTGGGERVTRQLIEVLASRGYRIRLVSDVTEQMLAQLPLVSYRRLDWRRGLERFLIITGELLRCDRDTCVLAVLTGPIIVVGMLNILFGRRVIAHEHSDIEQLYLSTGGTKSKFRLLALRAALHSVRHVAVVSDYLCERMPQALGCECKKVAVVRNPVQPFLQKLSCKPLAHSSNSLTAYIIGRNSEEKRHRQAIELLSTSPRVDRIILVARDALTLRDQLSAQANAKLLILDCLTEIDSFNTCSSFLFSYSVVESYSLVIAEWLASGLAVLTVDNEPMRRLWQRERGCWFVPAKCSPAELEIALAHSFDANNADPRDVFEPITAQTTADDLEELLSK